MYIDQLKALREYLVLNKSQIISDYAVSDSYGHLVYTTHDAKMKVMDINLTLSEIDEKMINRYRCFYRVGISKEEQKKYKDLFRYYFLEIAKFNPDLPVEEIVKSTISLVSYKTGISNNKTGLNLAKTVEFLRKNNCFNYNVLQEETSGLTVTKKGEGYIKALKQKIDINVYR